MSAGMKAALLEAPGVPAYGDTARPDAGQPGVPVEVSLAGAMSSVRPLGGWWASVPRERWPAHPEALAEMRRNWVEPWGDRRQELVFIGAGMDRDAISARLDAALVMADGFTPEAWADLPDPFPKWGQRQVA